MSGNRLSVVAVTVNETAEGGEVIVDGTSSRQSLIVQNLGTAVVYVGPTAGLTTSTGLEVPVDQSLSFDDFHGPLYGVVAAGSADVRVMEVS